MKQRLQKFMMGRYGNDQMNRFFLILVLICFGVSIFTGRIFIVSQILYVASLVLLVLCYARMFSRNIPKRYQENQVFLGMTGKITGRFSLWKKHMKQRKDYRFYKCPACHQRVRVPKGKGKISITCPACRNQFIKRS